VIGSSEQLAENPNMTADPAQVRAMCREAVADEALLRRMLAESEIVPQLLLHAHLTNDNALLQQAALFIDGGWTHMERIPDALREQIRETLIATLKSVAAGKIVPRNLTPHEISRLLSYGVNDLVPDDYGAMFMEEAAPTLRHLRSAPWRRQPSPETAASYSVIVAGAGASGLCMAIALKNAGIPFQIFERNDDVGGTWYENSYPGAGVDIPNHVYSFSFEPEPNWDRVFGLRDELLTYLKHIAGKYGLREHIQFGCKVLAARYDASAACWDVTVKDASGAENVVRAKAFVPSVGSLNRPALPNVEGLASFEGTVFHTARWDHSVDLKGKRVAIVGTGASSVQVGPTIAPDVARLTIFQRSPGWVGLNQSYHRAFSDGTRWAGAHIPYFYMWSRFLLFWASGDVNHPAVQRDANWHSPDVSLNARNHAIRETMIRHIEGELAGRPDLLAKVVPNYPPWGKRMLRDNGWFKMLKRDNVELVARGVARFQKNAIVDSRDEVYPVDVVVLATGFKPTEVLAPMEIIGRTGRAINDVWKEEGARAYLGMTVPEFPNMFVLGGPNTGLSHGGGIFFYIEVQVRYVMQCLREMVERNKATMEVRQAPHDEYNRRVDELHDRLVWTHPNVSNWYKNDRGRVVALAPWRIVDFWKMTASLNPDDYVFGDMATQTESAS
jgi:4-hydroxyacetophenone monooxygenase